MSATIKSLLSDLADYIFGDPIPAPEVIEDDPVSSWQKWEEAVKEMDDLIEFRLTQPPTDFDRLPSRRSPATCCSRTPRSSSPAASAAASLARSRGSTGASRPP